MGVYSNGQIAYDVYDTAAALEPGVLSGFVPPVTVIERFSIPDTATNCRIEFVLDNDLTTIVQPADAKISVDVLSGPVPSVGSSIPWDPVPAMGLGTMSVVKNGNPPDHISFNCAAYAGADMYLQFKVNPAGEALNLISWNDTNTGPIVHVTP
jgi:hypothetical protein